MSLLECHLTETVLGLEPLTSTCLVQLKRKIEGHSLG